VKITVMTVSFDRWFKFILYLQSQRANMPYVPSSSRHMQGAKRPRFSGRPMRSNRTKRAKPVTAPQLSKALVSQKQIKFYPSSISASGASGVPNGGLIANSSEVGMGTTDVSRIGDTINIQRWAGRFAIHPGTVGDLSLVRLVWFQWFPDTTLASPSVGDILNGTHYQSFMNYDRRSQYHILKDQTFALSSDHALQGMFDLKPKRAKAEYYNSTTTGSGQLFIIAISDDGATPYPALYLQSMMTFYD
jgi:hypothetical protein